MAKCKKRGCNEEADLLSNYCSTHKKMLGKSNDQVVLYHHEPQDDDPSGMS